LIEVLILFLSPRRDYLFFKISLIIFNENFIVHKKSVGVKSSIQNKTLKYWTKNAANEEQMRVRKREDWVRFTISLSTKTSTRRRCRLQIWERSFSCPTNMLTAIYVVIFKQCYRYYSVLHDFYKILFITFTIFSDSLPGLFFFSRITTILFKLEIDTSAHSLLHGNRCNNITRNFYLQFFDDKVRTWRYQSRTRRK
jgi:hypothetical protein